MAVERHDDMARIVGAVHEARRMLAGYLPPDSGVTHADVVDAMLRILDDRELVDALRRVRRRDAFALIETGR